MKVSIQIALFNGWNNNYPAIHHVNDIKEAENICYALSHQFGNASIRMCVLPDEIPLHKMTLLEYVSALSGTYIQSRQENLRGTNEWILKLLPK